MRLVAVLALALGAAVFLVAVAFLGAAALVAVFLGAAAFFGAAVFAVVAFLKILVSILQTTILASVTTHRVP